MKKYILTAALLALICGTASAQNILGRLGERAKQAVENNIGNKIEKGVNDILDGKKNKKGNKVSDDQESEESLVTAQGNVDFKQIQAKSDFKRGGVVFFQDDFAAEQLGEFPSKWDLLGGSEVEVVSIKGQKAVKIEEAKIRPLMEELKYLPEEFTIELDVLSQPAEEGSGWDATLDFRFFEDNDDERSFEMRTSVETSSHDNPSGDYKGIGWDWGSGSPTGNQINGNVKVDEIAKAFKKNDWNHIAFSFNKRALKVYIIAS